MNKRTAILAIPALAGAFLAGALTRSAEPAGPQLAHMVFFTLKDHSKESRDKFIASCQKYLSGHDGTVSFSVGTLADDVKEPVSVLDFDVALHLVVKNKAAKEQYLVSERHKKFVEENLPLFEKVRVFDSYLVAPAQ
jgi:hypothetical protein